MIKDIPHCYLLTSSLLPVTPYLCLIRIGFLSMPAALIKNFARFQSSAQRILFLFSHHSSLFTVKAPSIFNHPRSGYVFFSLFTLLSSLLKLRLFSIIRAADTFSFLSSLFSLHYIKLLLYISVLCVFPSSETVVVPLSVLPFLLWRRVIVMSVLSYKIFSVKSPKSLGSCG